MAEIEALTSVERASARQLRYDTFVLHALDGRTFQIRVRGAALPSTSAVPPAIIVPVILAAEEPLVLPSPYGDRVRVPSVALARVRNGFWMLLVSLPDTLACQARCTVPFDINLTVQFSGFVDELPLSLPIGSASGTVSLDIAGAEGGGFRAGAFVQAVSRDASARVNLASLQAVRNGFSDLRVLQAGAAPAIWRLDGVRSLPPAAPYQRLFRTGLLLMIAMLPLYLMWSIHMRLRRLITADVPRVSLQALLIEALASPRFPLLLAVLLAALVFAVLSEGLFGLEAAPVREETAPAGMLADVRFGVDVPSPQASGAADGTLSLEFFALGDSHADTVQVEVTFDSQDATLAGSPEARAAGATIAETHWRSGAGQHIALRVPATKGSVSQLARALTNPVFSAVRITALTDYYDALRGGKQISLRLPVHGLVQRQDWLAGSWLHRFPFDGSEVSLRLRLGSLALLSDVAASMPDGFVGDAKLRGLDASLHNVDGGFRIASPDEADRRYTLASGNQLALRIWLRRPRFQQVFLMAAPLILALPLGLLLGLVASKPEKTAFTGIIEGLGLLGALGIVYKTTVDSYPGLPNLLAGQGTTVFQLDVLSSWLLLALTSVVALKRTRR